MIADQLGNFTRYDVLGLLLGMLLASGASYLLCLIARVEGVPPAGMALLSAVTALAVALVKSSVPMSIALVAVALLLRRESPEPGWKPFTMRLCALAIGFGCGGSAGLIVLAAFVPMAFLARWAFGKE